MNMIPRSSPTTFHSSRFPFRALVLGVSLLALTAAGFADPAQATVFLQTNLVTDDQSVNAAQTTDTDLINAWGISRSAASPFWISDNGTNKTTIYAVNPLNDITTKNAGLTTGVLGGVTGQAFNSTSPISGFNTDNFLFVSEDGTIAGRRTGVNPAEVLVAASTSNVYKGSAFGIVGGIGYLYAANFRAGTIDVVTGNGSPPSLTGTFTDPAIPSDYAPFNIANLDGKLYVTYALKNPDPTSKDDVPGVGHGFVSVFSLQGSFLGRVASGGTLNSPWGLAIAPASFGQFAGDLLVGNFGDGMIGAYDVLADTFQGLLLGTDGNPLSIDGLWGLIVGSGTGSGGSSSKIYFTAGPGDELHGLFGVLEAPEPASFALLGLGLAGLGFSRRRQS